MAFGNKLGVQIIRFPFKNLFSKFVALALGIFLQIWQFRVLQAREYLFVSIITLFSATISQIDFGFTNLITSRHLRNLAINETHHQEKSQLIRLLEQNKLKIFSLLIIWTLLSLILSFGMNIFGFKDIASTTIIIAVSSFTMVFNGIGSLTSRMLLAIGIGAPILEIQLLSVSLQIILFSLNQSVLTSLFGLLFFPILIGIYSLLNFWKIQNNSITDRLIFEENSKTQGALLQIAQIFGLVTSLAIPLLASVNLSDRAAAIVQFQYKVASVVIAAMSSLYLNIQRETSLSQVREMGKKLSLIVIFSLLVSFFGILIIFQMKTFFNFYDMMPNLISWMSLIFYVGIQPVNIAMYYLILYREFYFTLVLAGAVNLLSILTLFSLAKNNLSWYFPAISFATLLSGVPMLLKLRTNVSI